jgi:hypothetical protein
MIGDNIVALDLHGMPVKRSALREKARVDVGDQDMTGFAAALAQPCRD